MDCLCLLNLRDPWKTPQKALRKERNVSEESPQSKQSLSTRKESPKIQGEASQENAVK